MLVSVIIPNYNHERFLEKRIESVLYQTYQNFEIIILDDCSKDNSRAIIEKYRANPKVSQIIYNDVNTGSTFKQWNKGINASKGDLVWMAESDDWCENNFLEVLVNGIKKSPSCALAFAQSYCIGDNNDLRWQSHHAKPEEYIPGKQFLKKRLAYGCTIFNASMAIFKKEFALKVPEEFTNFKLCGDWFFWINIARNGNVFISNKVLNYYRRSDSSLTSRLYATGYNFIEEIKMFQLVKAQRKEPASFITNSIFNRYNSFKKRLDKMSATETQIVLEAFHNSFGGVLMFKIFLFRKNIHLLFRKATLRTKLLLGNFRRFKVNTG